MGQINIQKNNDEAAGLIPMVGGAVGSYFGGPVGGAVGGQVAGMAVADPNTGAMERKAQMSQMSSEDRLKTIVGAKQALMNASPDYQKEMGPILDEAHKRALQEQQENQPEAVSGAN